MYISFFHRIALLATCFATLAAPTPARAGCNSGHVADTFQLSHAECRAYASGFRSTAVGNTAESTGYESSAFGAIAEAKGQYSTAIGTQSNANGKYSTSLGWAAGRSEPVDGAIAVGYFTGRHGAGIFSTAIGASGPTSLSSGAQAKGAYSIALGGGNGTADLFGKPLFGARSNYLLSIALGNASVANSDFAMAFGFNAMAGSGLGPIGPIAIGPDAKATLTNATALGRFSSATAENTTALGSGSIANKNSSVALGSGSLANVANTVSVGTTTARRRIVNVAPGVGNTDAATLGQVKAIATTAAIEAMANETSATTRPSAKTDDMARELAELRAAVKALQQKVSELETRNAVAQIQQ